MKTKTTISLPKDKAEKFKALMAETGLSSGELAKKLACEALEKGHGVKLEAMTLNLMVEKTFIDEMKGKNLSALIASVL